MNFPSFANYFDFSNFGIVADRGKVETKDRDLKWPESRKLSSLISACDLRRSSDTHLRHRVGSIWGGTAVAERAQSCVLPTSSLEQGLPLPWAAPSPPPPRAQPESAGRGQETTLPALREKEAFSSLSVPVTPRVTKNSPSSGDIPWQWDDLREGQQGSQVLKPGVCS